MFFREYKQSKYPCCNPEQQNITLIIILCRTAENRMTFVLIKPRFQTLIIN